MSFPLFQRLKWQLQMSLISNEQEKNNNSSSWRSYDQRMYVFFWLEINLNDYQKGFWFIFCQMTNW